MRSWLLTHFCTLPSLPFFMFQVTLSVEGNISAGKSTFLSILNRHLLQDEGFSVSARQRSVVRKGPCTAVRQRARVRGRGRAPQVLQRQSSRRGTVPGCWVQVLGVRPC